VRYVVLLMLTGGPVAALDPQPFEAEFVLESHGVTIGETHWKLTRDTQGFVWESSSNAAGVAVMFGENSIIERTEWRRTDDALRPVRYRYRRSGRRDKVVEIAFDWGTGVAYNTADGDTWHMQVPTGTLDKLSYLLALMDDLGAGKRNVRYDIADGGRLKEYRLHVSGSDTLLTEVGSLETLKVVRERPDSDRQTTLWMAPSLGYMPVRVEHRDPDGESITMSIRSFNPSVP